MFAVAFSPDGKLLAATAGDGSAYVWNVADWKQLNLPTKGGTVGQVAFSSDSSMMVATAADATAIITESQTGREVLRLGGGRPGLFGVAFSPGGKYLLTGSHLNGAVRAWVVGDNEVIGINRRALLQQGLQRVGPADLSLDDDECLSLKAMNIPLVELAQQIQLDVLVCGSPFLGRDG
jgi:WD40 repeat protein